MSVILDSAEARRIAVYLRCAHDLQGGFSDGEREALWRWADYLDPDGPPYHPETPRSATGPEQMRGDGRQHPVGTQLVVRAKPMYGSVGPDGSFLEYWTGQAVLPPGFTSDPTLDISVASPPQPGVGAIVVVDRSRAYQRVSKKVWRSYPWKDDPRAASRDLTWDEVSRYIGPSPLVIESGATS